MSESPHPEYLTVSQFAERFNLHRVSVTRMIREGRIRAVKVSDRLWLVPAAEADRFAKTYRKWKYTHPRRKKD